MPDKNAKSGKFFFNLRLKGPPLEISEKALFNVARLEGRVDRRGTITDDGKPKPDPIDKSLTIRVKQPGSSYNTVVPNKDKKPTEETVFKLRYKGSIPKLAEKPKDPTLGFMNEEAAERRRSTVGSFKKGARDSIEDSLR